MTADQLDDTKKYLAQFVKQARQITLSFGDMGNLLASGEVVAVWGGYPAVNTYAADAGNSNVVTQIELEEGSASFAEVMGVPQTAGNAGSALEMINQLLSPELNAEVANTLQLAPAIEAAWATTDDSVKQLFPPDKADEIIAASPMVPDAPAQSDKYVTLGEVTAAWEEVKAGI